METVSEVTKTSEEFFLVLHHACKSSLKFLVESEHLMDP